MPAPSRQREKISSGTDSGSGFDCDRGDNGKDMPNGEDNCAKEPVLVNRVGGGDNGSKLPHGEADQLAIKTTISKPTLTHAPNRSAEEGASPASSPITGKTTYNPITHAPSEWKYTHIHTNECMLAKKYK